MNWHAVAIFALIFAAWMMFGFLSRVNELAKLKDAHPAKFRRARYTFWALFVVCGLLVGVVFR